MRHSGRLRFRPPQIELPCELGWLLTASFAPPPAPDPSGLDPQRVAALAADLFLAQRLVARQGSERIRRRLGAAADALIDMHRRMAVREMAARQVAHELATIAADQGTPLLFLKGFALAHLAPGPPGWRPYIDLDLLVPAASVGGLEEALSAAGYRGLPFPANEQHLAPLEAPSGLKVDLHFRLRGVTLSDGWARAEELIDAGVCEPITGLPGQAAMPNRSLLAAHLLVHGIEQHGLLPRNYPLLRLVADLADLLPAASGWRSLLGEVWSWIRDTVTAAEVDAVCELALLLRQGRLPRPDRPDERDAELVLRHVVAGWQDEGYRRSIHRDHLLGRLRTARRQGELLRYILRKLRRPSPAVRSRPSTH